jgi:hypothetical protein
MTDDIKRFVIATLRRASYRWSGRTEAMTAARVHRGVYSCSCCAGLFGRQEIQLDHTDPVVPVEGWDNWEGFITRLYCDASGYSVMCRPCHKSKTFLENELRKQYRPPKIKKKKQSEI